MGTPSFSTPSAVRRLPKGTSRSEDLPGSGPTPTSKHVVHGTVTVRSWDREIVQGVIDAWHRPSFSTPSRVSAYMALFRRPFSRPVLETAAKLEQKRADGYPGWLGGTESTAFVT